MFKLQYDLILLENKSSLQLLFVDKLGARLEQCSQPDLAANAVLCYICSGNIDKFVECWTKQSTDGCNTPAALQVTL